MKSFDFWRACVYAYISLSGKDSVIGFKLQWAETKVASDKSVYGLPFVVDPFTHYEANAQRNAAQHKNCDEFHFVNDFTVVNWHG